MFRIVLFVLMIGISAFFAPAGFCQQKCVDAEGEAAINNNDLPSARLEAIARAKWQAIEKTVGIDVKAGSLVSNFALVEDVIKTQVGGSVKSYTKKNERQKDGSLAVTINACVEPKKAQDAITSELALNNGVAVFIPARKPTASGAYASVEETNILSETLIGKLTEQNYKVIDVAPSQAVDAMAIEKAMKGGSDLAVRSMMYKFLSNIIIIGKTDYTVSTRKDEDIGYGIRMPFNSVTVRLTYRISARNNKTGNMEILGAGTESGKGLKNNVEDAAAEALQDVAEKFSPKILDKVAKYIQGNVKQIRVKVNGITDLDTNMEVKGLLQNTVWVTGVEDKSMGEFIVSYP
ncbi:MAG: hypothetical protein PHN75_15830, partial [Syntrophales bacterium]|nr:hypothetical protein [Syntrophales bacterium]